MKNPFTEHPRATRAGQGYWAHGRFASVSSLNLIWAGLAGIIHAALPWMFPFYTADTVIRITAKLIASGRHEDSITRHLGAEWLEHPTAPPMAEAAE